MSDDTKLPAPNPWVPMTKLIDLKHLEKLGEECCEAGSAIFRCLMQGIDECDWLTGKVNREWLEDEIADVLANSYLVGDHFKLDWVRINTRVEHKKAHLKAWHGMLADKPVIPEPRTVAAGKSYDSAGGVWLTEHKTQLGMQYAVFNDPISRFLEGTNRKVRLDTRPDWDTLAVLSLAEKVKVVFDK